MIINCTTLNHSLVIVLSLICLTQCTISKKQLLGKYIDKSLGDTLKINNDSTYEYLEKLNSGSVGLTQGKWVIKNRRIRFYCDHKPLVGYWLKINRDSLFNNFQIRLVISNTEEPVYIEDIQIYKNGFPIKNDDFKKSKNVVKILTDNFDSILVQTFDFPNIKFTDSLNPKYAYVAKISPAERLYELDKVPFAVHKKSLRSIKIKEYENVHFSFKKIKNWMLIGKRK